MKNLESIKWSLPERLGNISDPDFIEKTIDKLSKDGERKIVDAITNIYPELYKEQSFKNNPHIK